jgi:hypothetical protein
MLRLILATFERSPGPVSLEALSRQLNMERPVLEDMLAELVRMGRLARIDNDNVSACAACGIRGRCPYLLTTASAYYALPEMVLSTDGCPSPATERPQQDNQ